MPAPHAPARRRPARGVRFEMLDLHLFPSLPAAHARLALVTVGLLGMLLSMLMGVLVGDYLFESKMGLPSDKARKACWRAAAGCVGMIGTVAGVAYHLAATGGEMRADISDIEALDRTV